MPSEFVGHFTRSLDLSTLRPGSPQPLPPFFNQNAPGIDIRKQALHALLVQLNRNTNTLRDLRRHLDSLRDLLPSEGHIQSSSEGSIPIPLDAEEIALQGAIISKLSVALYSDALDTFLTQATQVEEEAEYWADIEKSRLRVAIYLLQSTLLLILCHPYLTVCAFVLLASPIRTYNVAREIVRTLRSRSIPLNISAFSPSSLRRIFPSSSHFTLRPGSLTTAFFPHLMEQQSLSFSVLLSASKSAPGIDVETSTSTFIDWITDIFGKVLDSTVLALRVLNLPIELTAQECRHNRQALEKIRDQRAEALGELAQLRAPLEGVIHGSASFMTTRQPRHELTSFVNNLLRIVSPPSLMTPSGDSAVVSLSTLAQTLPLVNAKHNQLLERHNLLRPSLLTRMWPRLLIFPPLAVYVYTSRTSWIPALVDMANDAQETVRGFVQGWLVEPLLGVLHTVRAGGGGEVLVREEAIVADLQASSIFRK